MPHLALERPRIIRRYLGQISRIDLMMTDVIMGGKSGPELVVQLQELHPEVRVLYVSGYTEEATIHHGVFTEGIAFLQKPFAADGLVRKIREVLDG